MSDPSQLSMIWSRKFEEHFAKPPPDVLHHYTTQSGVLGIVESSVLWATKMQYLNDATELGFALDLAEQRIKEKRDNTSDSRIKERLSKLFTRRQNITNVNLFVACFCENGDLLSQWRGYSGASHGFSLAVKSAALDALARPKGFRVGKCIYEFTTQLTVIDELVDESLTIQDDLQAAAAFEKGILRVGAFFKNEKFSEENEWRIVSPIVDIHSWEVKFRQGASMLIPYLDIAIGSNNGSAIQSAVVGPCPNAKLSASSVTMLFWTHGLRRTTTGAFGPTQPKEVFESSIPYRNW